jgi:hypothetical protein
MRLYGELFTIAAVLALWIAHTVPWWIGITLIVAAAAYFNWKWLRTNLRKRIADESKRPGHM